QGFVICKGAAFQGTFGSSAITGQGHLPGYSPAQKTFAAGSTADYSCFEFDFYLDDISIITARNTKLYLNLRSGSGNGTSRGLFEFQNQLTENGWNHIRIITDLADDKLEILTMARFYIDIDAGSTGAADRYRVANIYAVQDTYKVVPAMTTVTPRFDIYEGAAFQGTFGSSAITGQGHMPGYSPAQKTFAAGSTAEYSVFEFDFYLDNISTIAARNMKLYLNLRSGSGSGTSRGLFDFTNQITASGWNHIKVITDLADDKLEILTMARFYIDIDAGDVGATDRYRVANIFATVDPYNTVPTMSSVTPRFDIYEGAAFAGTFGSTAITGQGHLPGYGGSAGPAERTFSNPGLSAYDFFEFDFYIDNYDNFTARNIKLYFNVRTNSTSKGTFEFQDQITHSGWNHIRIIADLSSDVLDSITKARFYIDMDAGSTGAADRYRIANICAVIDTTIDSIPDYPAYASAAILVSTVKETWGEQFTALGSRFCFSVDTVDLSGAEYIEFDIYIKNQATFHNAFDDKDIRFCISSEMSGYSNRRTFDFAGQITKDGWNHVVLDITEYVTNVNTDLTGIKRVMLDCWNGSGITIPIADVYTRVANVCAVNNLKHIVDFDATEANATFGNTYSLSLPRSVGSPVDFSAATSIDFDMYVQDYDTFVESFKTDAAGQPVDVTLRFGISTGSSYSESAGYYRWTAVESQVKHTGWNHISLSLAEYTARKGTYNDVDTLTIIQSCKLYYGGEAYKDGTYTNRIGSHTIRIKNITGAVNPIPSITVGKDQTEAYVTWLVGSSDYAGKVLLNDGSSIRGFDAFEHVASATAPYYCNRAKITGLESNTSYTYKVGFAGVWSDWYPLQTKTFSNNFSFVQVSDVQLPGNSNTTITNNWKKTLADIDEYLPDTSFIINTGDVSDSASKLECYNLYKSPELLKGYITSVIPGNHDEVDSANYASSAYDESFTVPTDTREIHTGNFENTCDYWYSYNNVLFIALASTIQDNAYHEAFVRRVVSEQGNRFKWKIVMCHYSLFSGSYHNNEGNVVTARNALAPVFSELGIDLVISGHDHKYLRSYIMNSKT
ncbi:MAG: metallophosphoesterase family protein, partial [Clostridia bacterium]|nr:metallophosphoesterase family protein [Clostridia bacterium]